MDARIFTLLLIAGAAITAYAASPRVWGKLDEEVCVPKCKVNQTCCNKTCYSENCTCCPDNCYLPAGSTCCPGGGACPPGSTCCTQDGAYPWCCEEGSTCCPHLWTCCKNGCGEHDCNPENDKVPAWAKPIRQPRS